MESAISIHMLWLISGIIMMALEFVVPGFVIIFFGAGAVLTGIATWIFDGISATWQTLLFVALSVGSLAIFRRHAIGTGNKHTAMPGVDYDDECIGKVVSVIEEIEPGKGGKVELDGTNWNAEADESIPPGARAEIVARKGLLLRVRRAA